MMGSRESSEFAGKSRYWFVVAACLICGILATVFGMNVFKTLSYNYYRNMGSSIVLDVASVITETGMDETEQYLSKISKGHKDLKSLSVIKFSESGKYVVHDTSSEHIGSLEKWDENDGYWERRHDILKGKEDIVFISGGSDSIIPTITVMRKYDSNMEDSLHSYVCANVYARDILSMIIKNCVLVFLPVWALIALMIVFLFFDYKNKKRTEAEYEQIIRKEEEAIRGALSKAENADAANMAIFRTLSEATKESRDSILSMASSAMMNIDDKECVKTCIERISKSGEHLDSIISNILNISGMETRKISLKKIQTSIPELIHTVVDEAKSKITEKDIKLDVIAKNIVHEDIVADAVRLNSVFSSIMDNAVKYTANGGNIRISVTEKECALSGYATYGFKISDNGIGMTEQYLEKIFEPFGEDGDSSEIENKGFGLITAKNTIDVMGGNISIESEKNVGTTVFVNVNLRISDTHCDSDSEFNNIHALILDRDEADALAMADMLKENGVDCEIYLSRRKAIDVAAKAMKRNKAFNAVFIENSIIETEDIDIVEALKPVVSPDAKIIAMSLYKLIKNKDMTDKGITGVLRKPLFKSDMYSVLKD